MWKKGKKNRSSSTDESTGSLDGIHFMEDTAKAPAPAVPAQEVINPVSVQPPSVTQSNSNEIEITLEDGYPGVTYPVYEYDFPDMRKELQMMPSGIMYAPSEENELLDDPDGKKRDLRNRMRVHGTRKCWARYCWADKSNAVAHSHPLETLSSNRLKLMGKEAETLTIRSGIAYKTMRSVRYQGERVTRTLDFYGPIYRRIEGYYGSGVAGYVALINRLLLMSFYTVLLLGGLFIVPAIVNFHRYERRLEKYSEEFSTVPAVVEKEIFDDFLIDYRHHPMYPFNNSPNAYYYLHENREIRESINQANLGSGEKIARSTLELLEGTGWMEASWMFLGQYADRINLAIKSGHRNVDQLTDGPFPYDLPFAFLCSIFGVLLISAIVLIFGSASSLKENLKGRHSRAYPFCEVLFSTWPHNLRHRTGVNNQRLIGTSQFKILLTTSGKVSRMAKTAKQLAVLYLIRTVVWLLDGGFLGVFGYLLYMAISDWASPPKLALITAELKDRPTTFLEFRRLLFSFLPSLIIAAFNFIVPMVLSILIRFEEYATAKLELRVTLIRTVSLRLASVVFLLFSVFTQLNSDAHLLTPNSTHHTTFGFTIKNATVTPCFETYVGQQMYKVLVLDILVSILVFLGLDIPRKFIYKATKWDILRTEFDLSGNILSAIYVQCLYWLGMFYAPLLGGMAVLHFLIKAIIDQVGIFFIFAPPTKIHHTSGSDVFFTVVALLSFFLALMALGFAIIKIQPSAACGPFLFMTDYATMYDFFMGTLGRHFGRVRFLIVIATSSVVLFPIVIFVAVILYYKIATARARAAGIQILKQKIADATALKRFFEARKKLKRS